MRCSSCDADNPETAKFCGACGTPLPIKCNSCGQLNRAGSRFCNQCGAALAATASPQPHTHGIAVGHAVDQTLVPEGERKLVTALFVDIINSTGLGQDLDPEEARAIIDPALGLMIDAVRRYDGHVVQSTGDGIFALFGAPVAHEDHPQRSLYAALRLQDEIRRMSDRLRTEGRTPIEIRAGVNTGEVVVRSIKTGDRQTEYTPIGHTVNLASRMQSVANAGAIVISDNTRNLVEGYFALRSLGPTRVKGINDSVRVYEVAGLGPLRTRLERSAGRGLSKFVGRAQEKQAFRNAARLARSGSGQLIAVAAEPGVGKSRLFFEFKAEAGGNWTVLEASSVSHGKGSSYLPVIELLHGYFGIVKGDEPASRREKVAKRLGDLDSSLEATLPYLYALLEIEEDKLRLAAMDPQLRRSRTFEAVVRVLLTEAAREPLMLIVEDLHWLDDESQALLDLLVEQMADARLLLLVNFRPEYQLHWGDKSYAQSLRLDALGHDNADEMLSAMLGESDSLLPLKQLIIETTGGTPFFMEETVQALFDEGALKRSEGSVELIKPLASLRIPPTVQTILAARIDRLRNDEKTLLQTLAVLGRQFVLSLARGVAGHSEEELERLLANLQLGEFVYEQPSISDVEYIFKHALTQEVAYNSILQERRKQLHEDVGRAIELLYPSSLDDHLAGFGASLFTQRQSGQGRRVSPPRRRAGDGARGAASGGAEPRKRARAAEGVPRKPIAGSAGASDPEPAWHRLYRRARLRGAASRSDVSARAAALRADRRTAGAIRRGVGQFRLAHRARRDGPFLGPRRRGDRPRQETRRSRRLDGGAISDGRDALLPRRLRRRAATIRDGAGAI